MMARALVVALVCGVLGLMGCGGGSSSPDNGVVGNWMFVNSTGDSGFAFDAKADGTYVIGLLSLTSTSTANAQVEEGNWSATSTMLTTTPTKWSCTGTDPAETDSYDIANGDLTVTTSGGIIVLQPNTTPVSSSFVLTFGCFDQNGNFAAQPLGPVQ
jgi:hypothetical protein